MGKAVILNTRLWGALAGTFFLLLILGLGAVGYALEPRLRGDPASYRAAGIAVKSAAVLLTLGMAFSLAPVFVRLWLWGLVTMVKRLTMIEPAWSPILAFLHRHEVTLVWFFWGTWLAGLVVAAP
ncbi:MAG: hypothetical protein HY660_08575 [Armatimonadetes bacterium]|nr:hypothetical protein [Armatimonadota bacterium]